jgi:hypothetical protein
METIQITKMTLHVTNYTDYDEDDKLVSLRSVRLDVFYNPTQDERDYYEDPSVINFVAEYLKISTEKISTDSFCFSESGAQETGRLNFDVNDDDTIDYLIQNQKSYAVPMKVIVRTD